MRTWGLQRTDRFAIALYTRVYDKNFLIKGGRVYRIDKEIVHAYSKKTYYVIEGVPYYAFPSSNFVELELNLN